MQDIYTCIGEFLDYRGLAKLRAVSKEARKTLTNDFLTKSRPHALAFIARQIIIKRIDMPSDPFAMHARGDKMLDFLHNSSFTLFIIDVTDTVSVNTVYTHIAEGRCYILGNITAVLTPSQTTSVHCGSVEITRNNETPVVTEYTDFLHALGWCPLRMPLV